jgi:ribosomal protein S8
MGILILTTPLGLMTGKAAIEKKVGGEVLCKIS